MFGLGFFVIVIFNICKYIDLRNRVTFKGYDEANILDKYKVCLLATEWAILNPDVKLKYYSDRKVIYY
jgi:hypothetical protein